MKKHLFLFGGGPPFTNQMARKFKLAASIDKPVSILVLEREGWEQYMPNYTGALESLGMQKFAYLPLPSTPIEEVVACLQKTSGIIIGGGNTNLYANYIVDTPIAEVIKERYERGIPVAGFSAGALISPRFVLFLQRIMNIGSFRLETVLD